MTTYQGSGDASRHRTGYRPRRLGEPAGDVTPEASVPTGIVHGAQAVRTLLIEGAAA
jgi:hypothetical protein